MLGGRGMSLATLGGISRTASMLGGRGMYLACAPTIGFGMLAGTRISTIASCSPDPIVWKPDLAVRMIVGSKMPTVASPVPADGTDSFASTCALVLLPYPQ